MPVPDPVADIAVLGTPDTQDLSEQADGYDRLIEKSIPLAVLVTPNGPQPNL